MKNFPSFGTDGIRGNAQGALFTSAMMVTIGKALTCWLQRQANSNPKIFIGSDTRLSCNRIKASLIHGITEQGGTPIDGGVVPSPVVLHHIQQNSLACGIVISASHNKYSDNGIKVFLPSGKISSKDEERISKQIKRFLHPHHRVNEYSVPEELGRFNLEHDNAIFEKYCSTLSNRFNTHFLSGKHIALDCAHGASYQYAPALFRYFGATVTTIGTRPNGTNINNNIGSTHPEALQELMLNTDADIGFALDGDGDRVVMVTANGEIKDGDDLLALLLQHDEYKNQKRLIGTIMTNGGLEKFALDQGKKLIRTPVGDKYVSREMKRRRALLGGERSGHIIVQDFLNCSDGIFTALLVLEAIILQDNWQAKTFTKMPQVNLNIPVSEKHDLTKQPYARIIHRCMQSFSQGRVVVRYSGTEDILRVMAEQPTLDEADECAQLVAQELQEAFAGSVYDDTAAKECYEVSL